MALKALSQSHDVRFDRGTFDVRNWEVRLRPRDEPVGVVDDVLVDEEGRSCYLDVDLSDGDRHVLLPCGDTEADRKKNVVWLSGVGKERLTRLPEYRHDPKSVDEDYERRVSSSYDEAYTDEGFYDRPDYQGAWRGRGTERRTETLGRIDRMDDVDVASGSPDPRGWEVVDRDGKTLGKIEHLIGDTNTMRVHYLTMRVDKDLDRNKPEILIPAGHADLDRGHRRVEVSALDAKRVATLPHYDGGALSREHERKLMQVYSEGYARERRYEHPRYRDDRLYEGAEERIPRSEEELKVATRKREAGEIDVKKRVEQKTVREPVEVEREEVEVERRPASRQAKAGEISEQEMRIPVREEEVVVGKEPRVKEEIVVRKRPRKETAHVSEKVKKERVDVDRRER